jgi:DNA-binding LacI/PurR family transcriptional regulator
MTKKSTSFTIRDVARKANVSVATVSRFINQPGIVSAGTGERLEKVMKEFQFVPHSGARQLATHKTRLIGLLLTNMHNDFFMPLLNGVETAVQENGYNLIVATYEANPTSDDGRPPIGPHNTDGMIIFANSLLDKQLKLLFKKNFPVVLVHRTSPNGFPMPYVTIENKTSTMRMIDHLIEVHGKRSILFMRGPARQEDSLYRELGYKTSLETHQLSFNKQLILNGGFEQDIAYQSIKQFLASAHPDFDAVFAGNDDAAYGSIAALKEAGYRVPEDIAVVGFDDQKLSAIMTPTLTTVRSPTYEVGHMAGEHIFAILRGAPVDRDTLLPTDLILRRSCGCCA